MDIRVGKISLKVGLNLLIMLGFMYFGQSCGSGSGELSGGKDTMLTGLPEVDVWTEKIGKSPKDTALYVSRYKVLMEVGDFARAVADGRKLVELDSTNVRFYRLLADAHFDNNDSRQAIKTLQQARERFAGDIYTRLKLAEMHLIVNEFEQSRIELDNLLKIEPYNTGALYMLGQLAKEQGDTMGALLQFQRVVEQDAEHHDAYIQLGKLADELGKPIALQYFDNALRIDSNSLVALLNKAQYYHQRGEFDAALVIYNKAVLAHPQEESVQYNMGLLYMERAELSAKDKAKAAEYLEKARKSFDNATKFAVDFGEAYYYLGLCYEKQGKMADARRHYENAVQMQEELGLAEAALARLGKQ